MSGPAKPAAEAPKAPPPLIPRPLLSALIVIMIVIFAISTIPGLTLEKTCISFGWGCTEYHNLLARDAAISAQGSTASGVYGTTPASPLRNAPRSADSQRQAALPWRDNGPSDICEERQREGLPQGVTFYIARNGRQIPAKCE